MSLGIEKQMSLHRIAVFIVALTSQAAAADPGWFFHVEPVEGRSYTVEAANISDRGFTAKEDDGQPKPMVAWTDVRRIRVEPPVAWGAEKNNTLVIDDDGRDRVTSNFGKIKLRKGHHRFELAYAHTAAIGRDDVTLQLDYKAPGTSSWTEVPESMLQKQTDWRWADETLSPGFDDEGFRLPDQPTEVTPAVKLRKLSWHNFSAAPSRVVDLKHIPLHRYSGSRKIWSFDVSVNDAIVPEIAGVFSGLLNIPEDGEYRFRLKSDGVAALYIGYRGPRIQERVHVYPEDSWTAKLAYGGKVVGPLTAIESDLLRFDLPHGPSKGSPSIVKLPVARSIVHSIVRLGINESSLPPVAAEPTQDILYATGGSGSIRGIAGSVTGTKDGKLAFDLGGEERTVPLDRVQAIQFAKTEYTSGKPPASPVLFVDLFGVNSVPSRIVKNVDNWEFDFASIGHSNTNANADKPAPPTFRMKADELRGFHVYGGGAFRLNDLTPTITRTPLFELPPVFSVDQSPNGQPLKIGRTQFESGYAIGPKTTLEYALGGAFKTLRTTIGLQAGESKSGAATVRVFVDDDLRFENTNLTSDDEPTEISVNILGCDRLTLEVDFGPQFDVDDVVVIADSELLREPKAIIGSDAVAKGDATQ